MTKLTFLWSKCRFFEKSCPKIWICQKYSLSLQQQNDKKLRSQEDNTGSKVMAATKYAVVYGTTLTYPYESETLKTFKSFEAADNWMHKKAKDESFELFRKFGDVHVYATCSSPYNEFGSGSNGIEMRSNSQIYSYWIEIVNNNN